MLDCYITWDAYWWTNTHLTETILSTTKTLILDTHFYTIYIKHFIRYQPKYLSSTHNNYFGVTRWQLVSFSYDIWCHMICIEVIIIFSLLPLKAPCHFFHKGKPPWVHIMFESSNPSQMFQKYISASSCLIPFWLEERCSKVPLEAHRLGGSKFSYKNCTLQGSTIFKSPMWTTPLPKHVEKWALWETLITMSMNFDHF